MFESHGSFAVSFQGNIVQVIANGPFNTEAVASYEKDVLSSIKQIKGPWGQLNFLNETCLFTPEAQHKVCNFTKIRKDSNLVCVAFIFNQNAANFTVREHLSNLYFKWDIPCQFFSDTDAAKEWLHTTIGESKRQSAE